MKHLIFFIGLSIIMTNPVNAQFSESEEQMIQQIVHDYLNQNPDILYEIILNDSNQKSKDAEENAILNAARQGIITKDCTIYTNLYPCSRCAGSIINAGISRVVCSKKPNYDDPTYSKDFKVTTQMFLERDVTVNFYED